MIGTNRLPACGTQSGFRSSIKKEPRKVRGSKVVVCVQFSSMRGVISAVEEPHIPDALDIPSVATELIDIAVD